MGHGVQRAYDATISSFATASSEVDLQRAFTHIAIEVPTMTSNTQLHIQAASESGGTFRRVAGVAPSTTSVQVYDVSIPSSTTNRVVSVQFGVPVRYVKLEATAVISFSAAYKVLCGE